ncbi:hybrid sensor histidine kinase/response regulator [Anaerolineales bacterium HSG6]|nr:hybrid sensor histidine kinase/response regulator [Anaerolineales bacterium HSG6]
MEVLKGNTVLVVDDNLENLDVLINHLDVTFGFTILVAQDGQKAISLAEQFMPDIILLDVMMPGINGFETCRRLKVNETTQKIPIIFMTALTDVDSKVKGFEAGGVDYVTKPIELQEVSARITTHLTLYNLQRELEARNRELDTFGHTVAHDIKNPIALMIGYAQILEDETELSPESRSCLKKIIQSGYRVSNIVEELQLLTGVRKAKILPEPFDMATVIIETKRRLAYDIERHQAQITYPDEWPWALGYAPWVTEVWVNYISNALKYGGKPPHLQLGATIQPDNIIRFWVQDNGSGLTSAEQAQLFIPFTRFDQVGTEGHGLGLSIVQLIMKKLNGQVGVESDVGHGSRFFFTLPVVNQDREGRIGN